MISFQQLALSEQVLSAVADAGFVQPTEIQAKTIGIVSEGRDLIASAQTGSGKTAAYVLPIIDLLRIVDKSNRAKTRALVIVPTRELALQVKTEFDRFSVGSGLRAATLYGGVGYRQQIRELHRGADLIVATPGRLLDCVSRNFAQLTRVAIVVLDEADRLLDMGFMPQVRAVIAKIPEKRQTLMFSATIDARMKKIAEEFLSSPVIVSSNEKKIEPASIEQNFHYIKEAEKEKMLLSIIESANNSSVLVFARTKRKASSIAAKLQKMDIPADEIHGDISQGQRIRTLDRFRRGEFNILVATDVAARGLDVPSIGHVVNYDLPMLPEDYVHRIGRTGRAGRSGIAHSFISADQKHLVRGIHNVMKNQGSDCNDTTPVLGGKREREAQAYVLSFDKPRSKNPGGERRPNGQNSRADQRGGRQAGNSSKERSPMQTSKRHTDERDWILEALSQEDRPSRNRFASERASERVGKAKPVSLTGKQRFKATRKPAQSAGASAHRTAKSGTAKRRGH